MKKIFVLFMIFMVVLGGISYASEGVEDIELPTLAQIIAKDYTSGMDFKELIERYELVGDSYKWFAYTYLASLEPSSKNTIHQAIAYDYTHGEDFRVIMDRYGLGTVDFAIDLLEPRETLEEAMKYDWENKRDIEAMKERYGIGNEDYFIYTLDRKLKEPNINSKEIIIINDWLKGIGYNELKNKYNFSDEWFLEGVKTLLIK